MLIQGVRDFSIHGAKKTASTCVCGTDGRCIGESFMWLELHPVTAERIVSISPSCCMCYLFFSTGPCREE